MAFIVGDDYYNQKEILIGKLLEKAKKITGEKYQVSIVINSEDYIYKRKTRLKQKGFYLLVSGSALDHGEEGVVGRGNKTSGIISSFRPYSMEAPSGKNPAYYTGIIYAYLANKLARMIACNFGVETEIIIAERTRRLIANNLYFLKK